MSAPNTVTTEMVKTNEQGRDYLRLREPDAEIFPDAERRAAARVISTGRSDYPNQINNVLAFPGIFRGASTWRAVTSTRR